MEGSDWLRVRGREHVGERDKRRRGSSSRFSSSSTMKRNSWLDFSHLGEAATKCFKTDRINEDTGKLLMYCPEFQPSAVPGEYCTN